MMININEWPNTSNEADSRDVNMLILEMLRCLIKTLILEMLRC